MKHPQANLPSPTSTASFWHNIIIIGSGITGASIARYLIEDGRAAFKKIVILEAREACWGATGRNGGHCQPLLFDRTPDVAAFEVKNVQAVKSYLETHNVPCEWRSVSGCRTFWSDELLATVEKQIAELEKHAPEIAKKISVIESKTELEEHRVNPSCPGATVTEGAGTLWPYKLVTFTLERLIKGGQLNLQTTTPVEHIDNSSEGIVLQTPRGNIRAPTVILATNGYTSAIVPSFADLIVPVRGQMSALLPPTNSTLLPNSYGMVGALGQPPHNDDYLIQRPFHSVPNAGGHLMFGGGRGAGVERTVGVSDDSTTDPRTAAYLRSALLKLLELGGEAGDLQELKAVAEWTGIMGYSRDNRPWVGKIPDREGLWLCGGYTGHGMPNGTLCGKAIAAMVLAEESGEDLNAVQKQMVEVGDLPRSYLITKERIAGARKVPTVEVQDKEGILVEMMP